MGRIVAIAGGDLTSTQTLNIHTIKMTNKMNPNVLFVGTASEDADEYIDVITKTFSNLKCEIKTLRLSSAEYSECEVDELLNWADIIYVGGGDTIFMMNVWKRYGLNDKLRRIYENDMAVLTGISAGAICWFCCGHSDSESFHKDDKWDFCWADQMLDIVHMAFCPHYNEKGRDSFDKMLIEKDMVGLAMENNTAFVENNGKQYFIRSVIDAKAFILQYTDGILHKNEVVFADKVYF